MGRLHIFESYAQLGVDNRGIFHYNDLAIGVWRSLVSRLVRVQEASGSNPDTPTKKLPVLFGTGSFFVALYSKCSDLLVYFPILCQIGRMDRASCS